MTRYILQIILIVLSATLSLAQTSTKIVGQVKGRATLSPLSGATVSIVGSGYSVTADEQGVFRFENLPAGEYQLITRSLGYKPAISPVVTITEDNTVSLTIFLLPEPITLPPEVVETSLGELEPLSSVILEEDQIQRLSPVNLSEVLNTLPGIQVQQAGPNGPARISIRGSGTDQVLVLLNGLRLNSAQTGEADLNAIPVSQVKRIELIKGAQTALYGADALAGVVNIITSSAGLTEGLKIDSKYSAGSYGFRLWESALEQTFADNLNVSISANNSNSDGDFTYPDSGKIITRKNSGHISGNLFLDLGWHTSDQTQARLSIFKYFARHLLPGPLLQTNDSAYSKDNRFNLTLNSLVRLSRHVWLESKAGYQDWRQTYHIQEPFYIPVNVDYANRNYESDTRLNYSHKNFKLTHGISFLHSSLTGDDHQRPAQSIGTVKRSALSTFFSGQQSLKEKLIDLVVISGAFRFDKTTAFKSEWSPQLGLLLSQGESTKLSFKTNWSKAYHNPSLNALFWKEDAYSSGNPNLKPERSTNFEAGLELRLPLFGEITAGQTYFHNNIKDLIVWQRGFDGKYSPFNVARTRIEGYEQYLRWQSTGQLLELEFNHTRTDALNQTEIHTKYNNLLPFRPRHLYNFKFYLHSEKLDVGLNSRYASRRFTREQNTSGKILSAYTIWDLLLKFKHQIKGAELSLTVGAYNFTDQYYELIERYPMPGREYRLIAQFSL